MILVASVTPFDEKGRVDHAGVARLLAWFEAEGCDGVVLAGTNGEGPSLSAVEKRDLIRTASSVSGDLQLVLGVASSSLIEAIYLAKVAGDVGASILLMPPSFFREASEDGLWKWLCAVLDASPAPVIVYNFPQRTGFSMSPDIVSRLGQHPQFAGLKDSSSDLANLVGYRESTGAPLYMGDETLLSKALAAGWEGTISGAANVVARDLRAAISNPERWPLIWPALRAVRSAPQPGTHKAVLHRRGLLDRPDLRLPLLPPTAEDVESVLAALAM